MKIGILSIARTISIPFLILLVLTVPQAAAGTACFKGAPPYDCDPTGDIDPATPRTYGDLSIAYANMAWQDFVALNWPAAIGTGGELLPEPSPDHALNYNDGSYTTVWETYIEARDLFPDGGATPPAFVSEHSLPDICEELGGGSGILLDRIAKSGTSASSSDEVLDEYIQANRMGPVVDVNGNYLRFGINFNEVMYDYVVDNKLYNAEGQEAFDANNPFRNTNPVDWPRGVYSANNERQDVGSIMLKASWRLLTAADDNSRYHTVQAYFYNAGGGVFGQEPTVPESCTLETAGLIGLHIVHRSNSSPQWVWSTFEHIDNAPWIYDFESGTPTGPYSLFSPSSCPSVAGAPSCAYNQLPEHPWNPDIEDKAPTQVIRIGAPGYYAEVANKAWHEKILQVYGNNPWGNYFLVDVQFPTNVTVTNASTGMAEINPAYPDGLPTPTFLANSTLETYIQGFPNLVSPPETSNGNVISIWDQMQNFDVDVNQDTVDPFNVSIFNKSGGAARNTSSCISCHGDAALVTGTSGSFVFSLSRASSEPASE